MALESERKQMKPFSGDAQWREFGRLIWRGVGMGIAEVIPGVSGGTVALITGVLDRLIEAIHSFDVAALKMTLTLQFKEVFSRIHWRFLVMLFAGQVLGILLCTRLISLPHLLRSHPEPVLGLFFGLVLGSIVIMAGNTGMPGWKGMAAYICGGCIGAVVVAGVRTSTPETPWFMAIAGAIAVCAWILPGISGSFMLLLMHKYDYVLTAVTFTNGQPYMHNILWVILPVGAGGVIGLVLFSRFLSCVFRRWPRYISMTMNGLLIASLWAIFPFRREVYETLAGGKEKLVAVRPMIPAMERLGTVSGVLAVLLLAGGAFFVVWLELLARRSRHNAQHDISG